jgi:Tol biopolymer transport system component
LLLCETFSADGSQNGIHVVRSSDGGGLRQITSVPGGDDIPGDWAPNGKRIVFDRSTLGALFVINTNGTGLTQITPQDFRLSSFGSWSPQGNEIVFSRHVTGDVHSSIWVVHTDGTGLHEINVQPASACGGANDDPNAEGCNEPTWSPDGTKIAFVRSHSNDVDGEIYTVNIDGTGLTQITHTGGANDPDWGVHPPTG